MNQDYNYEDEFVYIRLEMAIAKTFLDWRANPNASFRSLFRRNLDPHNKYKINSRELLNSTIYSTLFNLDKQIFISAYDYLRNNISPSMSKAIKRIKSSASSSNDNINTAKFLDIIRQSIVHNDVESSRPNCKLVDHNIVISYKNNKFSFNFYDFDDLIGEFINLKQNRFSFYSKIHARDLINHISKNTLTEDKMKSLIFIFDDDKNPLNMDSWQYKTLYNMFAGPRGELNGKVARFKNFYNDGFFIINNYFPFPHNAGAVSRLNNLCFRILPRLMDHYIDRDDFINAVLEFEGQAELQDDPSAPHVRQHLIQFMMDETAWFEATLYMNCLFGLFSSVPASKLQPYMQDLPMSASSLRNSIMHGRYFYNYDFGFELYDGKNNDSLVHTGTIDLYQIVRLVHGFLGDTFTYNR